MSNQQSNFTKIDYHQKPSRVILEMVIADWADEHGRVVSDDIRVQALSEQDARRAVSMILKYLDMLYEDGKLEEHFL